MFACFVFGVSRLNLRCYANVYNVRVVPSVQLFCIDAEKVAQQDSSSISQVTCASFYMTMYILMDFCMFNDHQLDYSAFQDANYGHSTL